VTDGVTRTSISLPHKVDPVVRTPSTGLHIAVYKLQSRGLGYSVTLARTDADLSSYDPASTMHRLADGLADHGATEVHLRHLRPVSYQGLAAVDGVLSFVSSDAMQVSYWRLRAVHDAHRLVQMQVLTFSDVGAKPRTLAVDAAFGRLVHSLRVH
jgi:hypothetical protein